MLNVAIEARALADRGGIRTYTQALIQQLVQQSNMRVELLHSTKPAAEFFPKAKNTIVPIYSKQLLPYWLHRAVPRQLARSKPDVVHFTKADVPRNKTFPTVVTIYDVIPLIVPKSQSLIRRYYWPGALRRAVTQSDHIITISEASKRGIMQHLDVPGEKITVTPLAVTTEHFSVPRNGSKPSSPYILFVGRWDLRKNIPALIQAFAQIKHDIPHQLVIAGSPADKPINLQRVVREANVADRVIFKENVPFADLPALYAGAAVFVYPSIIEGWGFPPQEAMACGTPVIVSDGDPLPEVVGAAGAIVPFTTTDMQKRLNDKEFISRLAQRIRDVVTDPDMRKQMSKAGLEYLQQFSWKKVAAQTVNIYKQVGNI